ncbi:hypothetical protein BDZ45DRAFT_487579 [Acephala macrosclerotiorum]|nr:hypothetical protein BDZ45DRAFT_487579 [Acephala macrosclerotiorum]
MDNIISHPSFLLFFAGIVLVGLWRFSTIFSPRADASPRVRPEPSASDNKRFLSESLQMIEEGYSKYKDGIHKLWTIDMDRLIISQKFMSEINKLPRSSVRLTTSERYGYTGMDICEESNLQYEVCAGALTRNIGPLGQTAYEEIVFALNEKLKTAPKDNDSCSIPLFISLIDLVTSSTARVFVGPDLCRNPE